ncbi:hypothetical protein [Nocardioides luteus]|uniref:Uncharacterized protein n=1 Tax=Nocardioides luteus TaxID=1844 RepID=A0A1J4N925_9ACTN|nr:hypothetical protein [Nocardioides luteus]OIJ27982.1 hypothetical protein UG56_004580 [Nocardioides luteus]
MQPSSTSDAPTGPAVPQGVFNIVAGLWPLLSLRSFEWVFGPKQDRWLEYTVAGLLCVNGAAQIAAARAGEPVAARRIGQGTALTLLAIDLVYVPQGRIRWTYLLDAALEAGWLAAWRGAR